MCKRQSRQWLGLECSNSISHEKIAGVSPVRDLLQAAVCVRQGRAGRAGRKRGYAAGAAAGPGNWAAAAARALWSEMSVRTLGTAWNLPMCNVGGRYSIFTVIAGAGFAGNQPSDGLSLQGCKKLGCRLVLIFCNNLVHSLLGSPPCCLGSVC